MTMTGKIRYMPPPLDSVASKKFHIIFCGLLRIYELYRSLFELTQVCDQMKFSIKIVLNAYSTSKTDPHFSKAVMTSSSLFYGSSFSNRKQLLDFEYIEQDGAEGHQLNDSVLSGFSRA